MADFVFKYGQGEISFSYPDEDILGVVGPREVEIPEGTEEEKVAAAIDNPVGCGKLEEIIAPDNTVCILVSDTTRAWAHPHIMVKAIVDRLNAIGVPDKHILIISAIGTHKYQTEAEHRLIVGDEIYDRITVIDHNCDRNLVKLGTSTFGNDIWVSKIAMAYDKRIIVCGTVFHFLAGFGGSRKYVLPGISGRETIMANHYKYFNPGGVGAGKHKDVNPGQIEANPIPDEMFQAADMVGIDFTVTCVMGPDKNMAFVYAGDSHASHALAVEKCRLLDGAEVDEPAEMVIASAMGYPKDLNLYQTTAKPMINAIGALKPVPESVLIMVSACDEGIGSPDTAMMMHDLDTAYEREVYVREHYNIGLHVAYVATSSAEDRHYILVSNIPKEEFAKTKIHPASTVEEAIEIAHKLTGKDHLKTYILPYAANTCVSVKKN